MIEGRTLGAPTARFRFYSDGIGVRKRGYLPDLIAARMSGMDADPCRSCVDCWNPGDSHVSLLKLGVEARDAERPAFMTDDR